MPARTLRITFSHVSDVAELSAAWVWVELLENEIPGFQALVVARHAVLIEQGGFLRSRNPGVSRRYGDRDDPGDGNQPHWGDVASFCSSATVLDFRSGGLPAR